MMNNISAWYLNLSLKIKLSFLFSLIIFSVAIFVYIYFPAKRKISLIENYENKATVIGRMTAFSISSALFFNDKISCEEAFNNAKQNDEVLYLVVEEYKSIKDSTTRFFTAYNLTKAIKSNFKEICTDFDKNVTKASLPIKNNNQTIGVLYIGLSLEKVKEELSGLRTSITIISLLIFIIGMLATYTISTVISKPLNTFITTIKEISHKNLDKRVMISSNDEVGELASTFNKMIDELQSAYSSIANMNKSLEKRVLERTFDLEQSKGRFETLYNHTPVMLYSEDKEGTIISVSDYWLHKLGYKREEVIGKKFIDFLTQESREENIKITWPEFLKTGSCNEIQYKLVKKNGEIIDVLLSATSEKNSVGNIVRSLSVLQDVTEKKKVLRDLMIAKDEAEKSDRFKSEFLAQMSHEIRSPLNVIFSFARLIREEIEGQTNPLLEESFNALELAGNRIIRTINMILDMSEIQTGLYLPEFREIDLQHDILSVIYSQYKIEVQRKGLDLFMLTEVQNSKLIADEYSLTQIFANLLDNAIKYTSKGKIEVVLRLNEKNHLTVDIIDTGIGITKEYIPNLFKPFSQEEQGYSRKYEGNGLGLALIKKYCDLNSASISVESEKDKGSKFSVIFYS